VNSVSPELEDKLFKKYPRIFPINGGVAAIQCGDGWYEILDALCNTIQEHIKLSRNMRAKDLRFNRAFRAGKAGDPRPLEKYFDFGQGAYKVDPKVADRVDSLILNGNTVKPFVAVPQIVASQVKSKFGSLRFYYVGGDEFTQGAVSLAERFSRKVCERCGSPAQVKSTRGWLSVLCDRCHQP
jgi:hypothetical protein